MTLIKGPDSHLDFSLREPNIANLSKSTFGGLGLRVCFWSIVRGWVSVRAGSRVEIGLVKC